MPKLTAHEVYEYAKKFLKEKYEMELEIPFEINNRLTRTLGRFTFTKRDRKPVRMEISGKYLVNGKIEDIRSTIMHECVHYALFVQGRNHRDGDDDFESELRKYGINSTGSTMVLYERNVNVYSCKCKEHTTIRALSDNGKYHSCKGCKAKLKYHGKKKMLV